MDELISIEEAQKLWDFIERLVVHDRWVSYSLPHIEMSEIFNGKEQMNVHDVVNEVDSLIKVLDHPNLNLSVTIEGVD